MPVVKIDEKGRIQLPKGLRHELSLRSHQPLVVLKKGDVLTLSKIDTVSTSEDPLLRDVIKRPLRGKTRITKSLLNEIEEKQWSG